MKKFIIKIAMFFAIFAIIDFIYGKTCEYLRQNAHGGKTYIDKYVCDSTYQDILIFGSSRARLQYNPQIIEDSLGMSCFNCGCDGMGIIYHYGRLKIISQRYMPKVILYDVLPVLDEMTRDDDVIFINYLRPYYNKKGIDSIFWKVDSNEKYKMLSYAYKYHSKFEDLLADYRNNDYPKYGFEPKDGIANKDEIIIEKTDYIVDSLKLYYLENLISEYKDRTTLIFLASPRYKYKIIGNAFDPLISLCEKYQIPFLNYYTDKHFINNHQLYQDATHFNKIGAEIYTKRIIKDLKKIIHS